MISEQQTISDPSRAPAEAISPTDADFLAALGKRVREIRERRGMTRKTLARDADVSERYLGQLELGNGNISVMLLRRIAGALKVKLADVFIPEQTDAVEKRRRQRVALVGLRGAGKSTLGGMLARHLEVDFIELNREIERETGLPVAEVFALYGQPGYRRFERRALERVLAGNDRAVLSVGGGIVAEEEAFSLLLDGCFTVWLRASPEEHMSRVLAQGDLRPMAGSEEAMEDLKRILAARETLYRKADAILDTSGRTPEESLAQLREIVLH